MNILQLTLAACVSLAATAPATAADYPADVNERLSGLGAQPVGGTPVEFAAVIQSETVKWAKVIKDANVELQ